MPRVAVDAVPTLAAGVDVRRLALSATEGFVLSRIDGIVNVGDICQITGLGEPETVAILQRLYEIGAIDVGDEEPSWVEQEEAPVPPGPSAPAYDPAELDEPDVELDLARRKSILGLYHSLADLNFYDLLGVPPTAERKEIREAYFAKSKEFHPDTLFRRKIGKFKEKMEVIFRTLTQAFDVLTNRHQRADYDAYIAEQLKSRELERQMKEAALGAAQMQRELVESVRRARRQAKTRREAEARRRFVLAQKLAALSGRQFLPRASLPPSERPQKTAEETVAEVRKLLQGSAQVDRLDRACKHAQAAQEAIVNGAHVAAANALRLAMALDPRSEEYPRLWEKAHKLAQHDLAEGYARQGKYEEELGHLERACDHYCKAAEGAPEAGDYSERAAAMLIQLKRDLRKAQEYASRAVAAHPKVMRYRLTLAQVYVEVNLPKNARRELEMILEKEPKSQEADELLKRVKKML